MDDKALIIELADLLSEAVDELCALYSAEYNTDHPYHRRKLAEVVAQWDDARAAIAVAKARA